MNPSLDNAEPQRVGAGVHADGGADLVNGYLMDGIAVFLKHTKGMVTESGAFFYIIAVSDGNTVAFDTEAAFFQISKKEIQRFLGGALSSPVYAGGEDLAFFQGDHRADVQNAAGKGRHFADAPAVF